VANSTFVDVSIINTPSSTKNKDMRRDPEMHQAKKSNQWYFVKHRIRGITRAEIGESIGVHTNLRDAG
jgi:hypothetical protein